MASKKQSQSSKILFVIALSDVGGRFIVYNAARRVLIGFRLQTGLDAESGTLWLLGQRGESLLRFGGESAVAWTWTRALVFAQVLDDFNGVGAGQVFL